MSKEALYSYPQATFSGSSQERALFVLAIKLRFIAKQPPPAPSHPNTNISAVSGYSKAHRIGGGLVVLEAVQI
jgi:hypothetical protein